MNAQHFFYNLTLWNPSQLIASRIRLRQEKYKGICEENISQCKSS